MNGHGASFEAKEEDTGAEHAIGDTRVDPLANTLPPAGYSDEMFDENNQHHDVRRQGGRGRAGDGPLRDDPPVDDDVDAVPTRIEHGFSVSAAGESTGPHLVVIGGNNRGEEFALGDREYSIGRGLDNDVVLADIAVSRKHTLIGSEGEHFVLRDLGSGNGILVNGERVSVYRLADGDQIEIGNTLIRFVDRREPGVLAEASTLIGDADSGSTSDVSEHSESDSRQRPSSGVSTQLEAPLVSPRQRTQPRKGVRRRVRLLVIAGSTFLVLCAVVLGLKLVVSKQAPQAPQIASKLSASELAAKHFDTARMHFSRQHWRQARKYYLRVYALAPSFEDARRYARQAAQEIAAQRSLERAKAAMDREQYGEARSQLAKIPSTSVYAAQVPRLKRKVDEAQVAELTVQAKKQLAAGHRKGALAQVEQALDIAPADKELKALHDKLGSKPRARLAAVRRVRAKSVPARPRVKPRTSRGAARTGASPGGNAQVRPERTQALHLAGRKAVIAYRHRQWDTAHEQLVAVAAKTSDQQAAEALREMAKSVQRVEENCQKAQGLQSRDPAAAIKYYERALGHDEKVGGYLQTEIKQQLQKVARVLAIAELSDGHYARANRALAVARRQGASDAELASVANALEQKAMDLFTKGYTIRKSNPRQAKQLWQKVLRIVPPSAKAYQKAYFWLNNTAPKYQDEDED